MNRTTPALAFLVCSWLAACSGGSSAPERATSPEDLREVWNLASRAVVEIEQFQAARSAATWEEVLALRPGWIQARVNLGIATLNKNSTEDEAASIEIFRGILAEDPDHPNAHYCLGILLKRQPGMDSIREAAEHFRAVLEADPEDAFALYHLGDTLFELGEYERARELFEQSLALEPLNRSAWYRLSTVMGELEDLDGQTRALEEFSALKQADRGFVFETKYGKMGPLGNVLRSFDLPRPPRAPAAEAVVFADGSEAAGLADLDAGEAGELAFADWTGGGSGRPAGLAGGVTASDLDLDGDLDLVLAHFGDGPDARLLLDQGDAFVDASEASGLASGAARTIAVAAADLDGDLWPELVLGRAGSDRVVGRESGGAGGFVRDWTGAAGEDEVTFDVAVADLDQDGDLDLAVGRASGLALYRWNGDGFEDVTAESGVRRSGAATVSVAAADADGDGDVDLVTGSPAPALWINDRLWGFRDEPSFADHAGRTPVASIALGDADGDQLTDWLLSSPEGPPRLLLARGADDFEVDAAFAAAAAEIRSLGGTLVDLDRDGDLDCLTVGDELRYLLNDGADGWRAGAVLDVFDAAGARGHVLVDHDGDGDRELVVARNGRSPLFLENRTVRDGKASDWIAIVPRGVSDDVKKSRGASLGIGARVEVRVPGATYVAWSGLGGGWASSAPQLLHFDLGGAERADVRIVWADGVVQSEGDLAGGQVHVIEQTDREPSSCPLVFFWNGETHEYLTDCLGTGGIGFLVEPGAFGPPDPEEVVRIGERLVPRATGAGPRYEVLLAEPMEEVVYLDQAELLRVEHPAGTLVYPDERFATNGELATGRPLLVREDARVFPSSAVSAELAVDEPHLYTAPTGIGPRDDRAALTEIDRDEARPFRLHARLKGYAAPWATELAFPAADLDRARGPVFLFVHGWVEYPFSRLNYAAWQGDLRMEPWTLSVPDGEGGWRSVLPEFGYPAGKPRTMALDVTPFLDDALEGGAYRLRLSSNLVVSLDQAYLAADLSAEALASGAMRVHEIDPAEAELAYAGFPREYSPDGKSPLLFDHANRDRTTDFKALEGRYTEYGDALDLVLARDDRFAIYARGDELALRFDPADLPARRPDARATFLLRVRGYCKDMCPQTAHPRTVEPLPFAAMENYPPEQPLGAAHPSWLSTRNTRREPPRPIAR